MKQNGHREVREQLLAIYGTQDFITGQEMKHPSFHHLIKEEFGGGL